VHDISTSPFVATGQEKSLGPCALRGVVGYKSSGRPRIAWVPSAASIHRVAGAAYYPAPPQGMPALQPEVEDQMAQANWMIEDRIMAGRCIAPVVVYAPGQIHSSVAISALVDTGAMHTAISAPMAEFLRLPVVQGKTDLAAGVGGSPAIVPYYFADLEFLKPGLPGDCWPRRGAVIQQMLSPVPPMHMLIGMDIIGCAHFFGVRDGVWTLEF